MINNCPSCGSNRFQVEDAAPPHGQKLICSDCSRFIKWLPSSQNIERHRDLKVRLESLKNKVGGWDSAFISSLIQKIKLSERDGKIFKLSPRQLECLEKIEAKLLTSNPQNSVIKGGAR